MDISNRKRIEDNLKTVLTLEYLGIHIEDTKEKDYKLLYYFSVPEKSTIKIDDTEDDTATSEGLIQIAKETFTQIIIDSCKSEFSDDDYEFYNDVENNISEYASFYAKVRDGEIWNEEMGKAAMKKISDEIKSNSYKQV